VGEVCYDLVMMDLSGISSVQEREELMHQFWCLFPTSRLSALIREEDRLAIESRVPEGAFTFLSSPLTSDEVREWFKSQEKSLNEPSVQKILPDPALFDSLFAIVRTSNSAMKALLSKVRAVARTESTVLLTGETGTGKGMLARLIHHSSGRWEYPFVSVQCSAIAETLLESELFGHEKGAFTGAIRRKPGKFEIAQRGSVFLDEIGTISPATQLRLLQILEEKVFQRVGGEESLHADVRIIAATNSDLLQRAREGSFRMDLYYRLNVFPIEIPPLRERTEDIPDLVHTFLQRLNRIYRKEIQRLDNRVMEGFLSYGWPGNVRELENLIERAYILEPSDILTPGSFPPEITGSETGSRIPSPDVTKTLAEVRKTCLDLTERLYLQSLLEENQGRIDRTAAAAGIGVRQLHKLLTRHDLRKENFRPGPIKGSRNSERVDQS
jgi:transcriptional regulator with GAF, ATPase, and Fis domain